jgi:hypothetical protein
MLNLNISEDFIFHSQRKNNTEGEYLTLTNQIFYQFRGRKGRLLKVI